MKQETNLVFAVLVNQKKIFRTTLTVIMRIMTAIWLRLKDLKQWREDFSKHTGDNNMKKYIIVLRNIFHRQYWNNDTGWTEIKRTATRFTEEEKNKYQWLPLGGQWMRAN